jgi:hypothetical protein
MLLTLGPVAYVFAAIGPFESAVTVLLVVGVFAYILAAISPGEHA